MRPHDPSAHLPLTHLTYHLLLALAEEPAHAYGLVQAIREQSDGAIDPGTGSFYSMIRQAVDQGLIQDAPPERDADARRRRYAITALGRRVLEAEASRLETQLAATRRTLKLTARRAK